MKGYCVLLSLLSVASMCNGAALSSTKSTTAGSVSVKSYNGYRFSGPSSTSYQDQYGSIWPIPARGAERLDALIDRVIFDLNLDDIEDAAAREMLKKKSKLLYFFIYSGGNDASRTKDPVVNHPHFQQCKNFLCNDLARLAVYHLESWGESIDGFHTPACILDDPVLWKSLKDITDKYSEYYEQLQKKTFAAKDPNKKIIFIITLDDTVSWIKEHVEQQNKIASSSSSSSSSTTASTSSSSSSSSSPSSSVSSSSSSGASIV